MNYLDKYRDDSEPLTAELQLAKPRLWFEQRYRVEVVNLGSCCLRPTPLLVQRHRVFSLSKAVDLTDPARRRLKSSTRLNSHYQRSTNNKKKKVNFFFTSCKSFPSM